MENLVLGTHHVSLKAEGIEAFEKTVVFYRDLLGMSVVRSWGEGDGSGIMINTGDCLMEITANGKDNPGAGSIRHIAFLTNDVDKLIEIVRSHGYNIRIEPRDSELPSIPPYKIRIAFCTGPCGEDIEFFQER